MCNDCLCSEVTCNHCHRPIHRDDAETNGDISLCIPCLVRLRVTLLATAVA